MHGIVKTFPGVQALKAVDFDLQRSEVHALVGENGAGKSTLMKILSSVYQADAGEIIFKGAPVHFRTPHQAQDAGIVTIYQELNQVPYFSVTENIFLGSEWARGGFLDWQGMHREARRLLAKLHLDIDPHVPVNTLGVGRQQMVEVAKALHHKADLIIMDGPTSSLSVREIDDLFAIIAELKAEGVAIIYISHHLSRLRLQRLCWRDLGHCRADRARIDNSPVNSAPLSVKRSAQSLYYTNNQTPPPLVALSDSDQPAQNPIVKRVQSVKTQD